MKDYSAMTMDELNAEFVRLAGELAPIEDQRKLISDEMTRRRQQAAARVRLQGMTAGEIDALLAVAEGRA